MVNPSHGDVAMASMDGRYEFSAVVKSGAMGYRAHSHGLSDYLIPKKPQTITAELLHQRGRGIAYTKSAFAYLFRRVS